MATKKARRGGRKTSRRSRARTTTRRTKRARKSVAQTVRIVLAQEGIARPAGAHMSRKRKVF